MNHDSSDLLSRDIDIRTLLIIGAGQAGKSMARDALESGAWQSVIFLDDAWPRVDTVAGWPVVGRPSDVSRFADSCDGGCVAAESARLQRTWSLLLARSGIPLVNIGPGASDSRFGHAPAQTARASGKVVSLLRAS